MGETDYTYCSLTDMSELHVSLTKYLSENGRSRVYGKNSHSRELTSTKGEGFLSKSKPQNLMTQEHISTVKPELNQFYDLGESTWDEEYFYK